jgi:hypothetical protein
MVLAPRNDELPDAWLAPRTTPIAPSVEPWVDLLASSMDAAPGISPGFKTLWHRYVGL